MINNLTKLMITTDTSSTRLFLAVLDILWGVWLLLPMDTFTASKAYDAMEFWAPEAVWGTAILIIGLMLLYHLRKKQYWSKLALISLFGNIVFWGIIVISILVVSPTSTGVIVYSLIFLISCGLYVKGQVYRREYRGET